MIANGPTPTIDQVVLADPVHGGGGGDGQGGGGGAVGAAAAVPTGTAAAAGTALRLGQFLAVPVAALGVATPSGAAGVIRECLRVRGRLGEE